MRREQMVQRVYEAMQKAPWTSTDLEDAAAYVDVILPQVSTVAELEALPEGARLMSDQGRYAMTFRLADGEVRSDAWLGTPREAIRAWGPLTVIWTPDEVTA